MKLLILILCLFVASPSVADSTCSPIFGNSWTSIGRCKVSDIPSNKVKPPNINKVIAEKNINNIKLQLPVSNLTMNEIFEDEEIKKMYKELVATYIKNEQKRLYESAEVVGSNNWKSTFIFWMVHSLLLLSITASVYEFFKSRVYMKIDVNDTELSIEAQKFALKTSLQGVVLLCISMVFYFLYHKYVHPIIVI